MRFSEVIPGQADGSSPERSRDGAIPRIPVKGKKEKGKVKYEKEGCAIELTMQERDLLRDVWGHPTSAVTERYRRLCFSRRVGNSIQHSLVDRGLVSCCSVRLGKGRIKVLSLTEKGKKVLGVSAGESDRHGGPEHRYWVKRIADHLRADGWEVAQEVPIGSGKAVDIVGICDGKRIAFEIETGKSYAVANVQKCLKAGMDRVFVVATSANVKGELDHRVPSNRRVKVLTGAAVLAGRS